MPVTRALSEVGFKNVLVVPEEQNQIQTLQELNIQTQKNTKL